jgi:hypothetical protein
MRLAPTLLALLILPTLALSTACRRQQEEAPPPPPPAAPVSIWGDTESQSVAKLFVEAAVREAWTSQFRDRNSRPARMEVGEITDRSGKQVPVDGFAAAIAAALAGGGADKLAAADGQPDLLVTGAIGASAGTTADGAPATYFAIDLSVSDKASGDKTWHFAVEFPVAEH